MTQNLLEAYQKISLLPIPACQCNGYICAPDENENPFYLCETCGRSVPYCYGADDEMFESCDDCWCAAHGEETANV